MKKLLKLLAIFLTAAAAIASMCVVSGAASVLPAPTGIVLTASDTSVKIVWDEVRGADAYRVYKYDKSLGKFKKYKNVSGTVCNVTGLKKSTEYRFKVAALVKKENIYTKQTISDAYKVKTFELPAPENIGKFEFSDGDVILQWYKMSGADAYRAYILDSKSGKYKVYKDALTNNSVDISSLKVGKTYTFIIAALTKNSDGSYKEQTRSGPTDVKLTAKLDKPANVRTKVTGSTLTITWSKVKGAATYTIDGRSGIYSSDGNVYNTYVPNGSGIKGTSYSFSVKKGKYFLKICANPEKNSDYDASEWYYFDVTVN